MDAFSLVLVFAFGQSPADSQNSLTARLEAASKHYDLAAADALRAEARQFAEAHPSREASLAYIEAALLSAELRRIEWEQLPESNIAQRRPLGNAMDAAAEEALTVLKTLEPDSNTCRLKADLLGIMIRSDYRAKKYRKDMEAAAAKAVELDPANAKAYVSLAKPFIFAEKNQGGDPERAVELLTKSLELDPGLETARCLRGLAYQKAGRIDEARADWELALKNNADCQPAKEELAALKQ